MKLGSTDISDLKLGSTDIDTVRLGSTLIWQRSSPSTPPSYEEVATASSNNGTSIDVNYTSTVNLNDCLVMQVIKYALNTFTTPSGWIELTQAQYIGTATIATYIKRATGSESGTVTVQTGASSVWNHGTMFRVSGVVTSGTMYEDFTDAGASSGTTINIPVITTLGANRLAIALYYIGAEDAGEPSTQPTDYTEQYSQIETSGTPGATLVGNTQAVASAGDVDADSSGISISRSFIVHAFALIPE
jgi:hypothetical protein